MKLSVLTSVRDRNFKQLSQREMKMVFEDLCDSDFSMLRDFMRYVISVKFTCFMNNDMNMNMNMSMNNDMHMNMNMNEYEDEYI